MGEAPVERGAVLAWRRARRAELIAARTTLSAADHHRASHALGERLGRHFMHLGGGTVGFYWPFRREFNPLPFVRRLIAAGGRAALPVVVAKDQPLQFRPWHPETPMALGVYDIPYPAEGETVTPDALLVALVGFDEAGYRLGYGGGYYDRTIAACSPRPLAIGIGFELGRLATIHPLPHDIPMEFVATEAALRRRRDGRLEPVPEQA